MAGSRFLHVQVGDELWTAVRERSEATGVTVREVVVSALTAHLQLDEEAFQASTIGAVMDGVYNGEVTIGELRGRGDIGIGTFDDLDGEMVMLDGVAYRIDADCAAHLAEDGARTPFATVAHWVAKHTVEIAPGTELAGLQATLDDVMSSHNYLYAVRLEARFRSITVRSVKPQEPGTRLIDATRTQTVRTFEACEGTVVGFYTPEFLAHVGVPGLHVHFITQDRSAGGHVLSLTVERGTLMTDETLRLSLSLPATEEFRNAALAVAQDELEDAEH